MLLRISAVKAEKAALRAQLADANKASSDATADAERVAAELARVTGHFTTLSENHEAMLSLKDTYKARSPKEKERRRKEGKGCWSLTLIIAPMVFLVCGRAQRERDEAKARLKALQDKVGGPDPLVAQLQASLDQARSSAAASEAAAAAAAAAARTEKADLAQQLAE